LSVSDALAVALFIGMLLVAKAAPYLAPGSDFALWLDEPYAYAVYVIWAWILTTMLFLVIHVVVRLRDPGAASHAKRDA